MPSNIVCDALSAPSCETIFENKIYTSKTNKKLSGCLKWRDVNGEKWVIFILDVCSWSWGSCQSKRTLSWPHQCVDTARGRCPRMKQCDASMGTSTAGGATRNMCSSTSWSYWTRGTRWEKGLGTMDWLRCMENGCMTSWVLTTCAYTLVFICTDMGMLEIQYWQLLEHWHGDVDKYSIGRSMLSGLTWRSW